VYLALAVGCLGIIIGACQSGSNKVVRWTTVGLGLIVSIITLCTNTIYSADYHTLGRAIHSVHPLLESMRHDIELYDPAMSAADFKTLQTEFYKSSDKN
jgi:hypothetical protein